ncbi:MAG TPA: hypothetical protein VGP20_02840 [Steroidobacteraceae bacterium]|nr:hypothetical protein [Steroidobacteraceae bacterium]
MTRRHPKRRLSGKHYAMVPVEVLTSQACNTLPASACRVLLAIAAQFRGKNNGDLALTWATARPFGINSKKQLIDALALLLERGLIEKTRQGGKRPLGPSLYAVGWMPIDDLNGKIDSGPTMVAKNTWATWPSAPQRDQSAEIHQHHRGTSTAPQGDQTNAISAPQRDQSSPSIGTTGGAPSISIPEGPTLRVVAGGRE